MTDTPTPAPQTETCQRCQGNGEIVTDWERYRHPRAGDVGDEAVAECPDCNGEGVSPPSKPDCARILPETIEDWRDRMVVIELGDGRRLRTDARHVRDHGLKAVLEARGITISDRRIPVLHHGREIGSLPETWHPMEIKSTTFLYDPRPGDFVREGDTWVAHRTLGPGDIAAVPDFRPSEST